MSGYPILLDGAGIRALVVGGGAVAARKARGLLESGASVRVVAPEIAADLLSLSAQFSALTLIERAYQSSDIADATLVVAATDTRAVNAQVAADAHTAGRLVNVADVPTDGDWVTVAVHRVGQLIIGVSAGGVPSAAARIRDAIGQRFDTRYAEALASLARLRRERSDWAATERTVIGPDFCDRVERGEAVAWR